MRAGSGVRELAGARSEGDTIGDSGAVRHRSGARGPDRGTQTPFLIEAGAMPTKQNPPDPAENRPALRVTGLVFSYPGSSEPTVRVGSLSLDAGEQVVLTGSSGRGKSTLLHLIAGLMEPDRGEVEVAGTVIGSLRGSARDRFRGRQIGMVFQTFHLLHGFSAAENVMAAMMFSDRPRSEHKARAIALLERLGIDRPHAPGEDLSVGQQQRVAVARALACGPSLVLADEPTASLDPENAAEAVRLLRETCRENNAALLCVTHDPSLVGLFDRHESLDALAQPAALAGV
jgi:putative ABC transport system ATP-binding protein|tara:strand:+ start:20484 stop:21347 length:864 start_codon:yes stop_codon:yes gene_type:complete